MTKSCSVHIGQGSAADWRAVVRLMKTVFLAAPDGGGDDDRRAVYEPDRSLVAYDGGDLVGHSTAFTRDLTVPGGSVPACHISMIGVEPTFRRRGLLRQLITRQFAEAPEPIAVGWPVLSHIYARFGMGMATQRVGFTIDTREVGLPEPAEPGELRTMSVDEARPVLRQVYDSILPTRSGWSSRDERWWGRVLADPPGRRAGSSPTSICRLIGSYSMKPCSAPSMATASHADD